jgi:hypothetical protein
MILKRRVRFERHLKSPVDCCGGPPERMSAAILSSRRGQPQSVRTVATPKVIATARFIGHPSRFSVVRDIARILTPDHIPFVYKE